jgi:RNA polymerase sigma-70 factor (ECF subfamily)
MPAPNEPKCVNEILGTNPERGFEALFNEHYSALCAFAMKYVNSTFEAEQCAMDVFLKIWEKRKTLKIKTDIKYYLYASVRNRALDLIRKNNLKTTLENDSLKSRAVSELNPEDELFWKTAVSRVECAIDQLPKKCQRIFMMSRYDGKKYHEIASELNLSIKTVETQISRALKSLRKVRPVI